MKPTVVEVLSLQELEQIHAATVEVLETVGVEFHHEEALAVLRANGARVEGSRVYISAAMLTRALDTAPERFFLEARNPAYSVWIGGGETVFAPPAGCVYVQDLGRTRRLGTRQDYSNLVRIVHQSSYFGTNGGGLVIPDSPELTDVENFTWMALAGHWYSDKPQMGLNFGVEISQAVLDISTLVFQGRPGYHVLGTINPDSPLVFSKAMLESMFLYARAGQALTIAPCSMAMATSPATLAGTLVMNNAEVLAGLTLAQLIKPGTPVLYGNTSTISDMNTMTIAIGAPELALLVSAVNQLARHYKLPSRTGGALTDAKTPDIQAGMESMLSMVATVTGHTSLVMHSAGILDSFLTFSYEKLVMDEEVGGMARRFGQGLLVNSDTLAVAEIQGKGPGSHFLDTEYTLKHFKQEFWRPAVSDRQVYRAERDYTQYSLERAKKVWQKRISVYSRPLMPLGVEQALLGYYKDKFDSDPDFDQ